MSQTSETHRLDPKPELLLGLPDVPTLAILSLLPLRQLIVNLPLVHRRLAPIRESVLKGVQHLVLHIGHQKATKELQFNSSLRLPFASHLVDSTGALLYPETDIDTLHFATLNRHSVEQLSSLMPGIIHLQVVISGVSITVLPHLATLLAHWAPTLRTLKLNIGYVHYKEVNLKRMASSPVAPTIASPIVSHLYLLIQDINRELGALQHLTLDIGGALVTLQFNGDPDQFLKEDKTSVSLRLSILGQLREFYLNVGYCPSAQSFLLRQLAKYATEKLTSIGLGGNFNWSLKQVANSPFAARFTMLPFNDSPTSNDTLHLSSLPNLTVYGFNWQEVNAPELVAHLHLLSTLSHLQCLKMNSFSPVSHPLPAPFPDFPSLRSVTVLEMNIDLEANGHHNHLKAPYLANLFPSLQIVKVRHEGIFCTICYPDEDWNVKAKITDYAEVTPCLRQLFAPLRVLPSLRKIFYQREGQSDFMAELTPQGDFVRTHEYIG